MQDKKIFLTQGKFTIVDTEDFDYLNKFKWCISDNGYAIRATSRRIGRKILLMHRVILNPYGNLEPDHINRNKLDNRRCNLRLVTRSENIFNRSLLKSNTTGYKGISWNKSNKNWRSNITVKYKYIDLGSFKNLSEAIEARSEGEKKYFGKQI